MPKKGTNVSEETRERMRASALKRDCRLTQIYGFTQEFINAQKSVGNSWCSDCKSWYAGRGRRCKECAHKRNADAYYSNPEERRERRKKWYQENKRHALMYRRKYSLAAYGVTENWYAGKLAEQGGGCALCGTKTPNGEREFFSIDHDHACCGGKKKSCDRCRRGLLCDRCNFSIERAEAIPGWLDNVAAYLQRYRLV